MNKYVLETSENGLFFVFEIDENDLEIDWYSQSDLNDYKTRDITDERREKINDVLNWMKKEYPELII